MLCLACAYQVSSAAIRIADYNICGEARKDLPTVLAAIGNETKSQIQRPIDILLLQEQTSVYTTTQDVVDMMNDLYGSGTYSRGSLNGSTTGGGRPGIVYNTTTIELLEEVQVNPTSYTGAARSTIRYKVRPVGYTNENATFYLYNSHYKAATDSEDRRAVEAQQVRDNADALGDGVNIMYAGDLNLYNSYEQAWSILTGYGNGKANDPLSRTGTWHDNSSFKDVHTQSPVTYAHYDGQITGGMDDRFDFQLLSDEVLDGDGISYIPGTYRSFGNNGTHNLNSSISSGTGAPSVALAALEEASDHLPVVADYQVPAIMEVTVEEHPSWPVVQEAVTVEVNIENIVDVDLPIEADELAYTLTCTGDISGSGSGSIDPLAAGDTFYVTLDTSTLGEKSGQIVVTALNSGTEPASYTKNITYTVIDSGATTEQNYGWENFVYKVDPQTLLDSDAELSYQLVVPGYADSNSLQIQTTASGSYSGAVAIVTGLIDGDEIEAGLWAKKLAGELDGIFLSAEYLTDPEDVTSTNGTIGELSADCGTSWSHLTNLWTFDNDGGTNQAMLITVVMDQQEQTATIDDLAVVMPMHCLVEFPEASTVICTSLPEYDYNGNCIVDLADFAVYATNWLDGEEGASQPGQNPGVLFTGIMDGTYSSRPRAIEMYVSGSVDLSNYTLQRSLGGGTWSTVATLSGIYENEFVYLIGSLNNGVTIFESIFGTEGDFANHALESSLIVGDGNDSFRLLEDSTVIDQVYAQTGTDAYEDSYMYRVDFTGPNGGWVSDNWTIPGNNILDGMSTEEIGQTVPFGSFVYEVTNCTEQTYLDLNEDCQVNLPDLIIFINSWLDCNYDPNWVCNE